MRYSPADIISAWVRNGGSPSKAIEAAAVSYAESGHDDNASSWCCHGVWALHQDHTPVSCSRNLDCATKRAIELSNNGKDWSPWDVHRDASGRTGFGEGHAAIQNFDEALAKFQRQFGGARKRFRDPQSGKLVNLGEVLEDGFGPNLGPFAPFKALPDVAEGLGVDGLDIPGIGPLAEATNRIANFFGGLGSLLLDEDGWRRIGLVVGGGVVALIGLNSVLKQGYKVDPVGTAKKAGKTAAVAAATKGKA